MWGIAKTIFLLLFLGCLARADAGLMLGESTGQGMSRWTSAGHSAVYLSRVCPDGPVHLRLCASGEQGSVISNYIDFKEDKQYEWNIVPLSVFLFGVEDPANRPIYAAPGLRAALQERFRRQFLGDICPDGPCTDPKAHWRDVVAANFVRDVYMFVVKTTPEQDEAFIAKFNALPNIDHYNGFTRNCADFARLVINSYFPGAARPDHINDFWMTSPKAISKSFTHYGVKHPELQFHVVRFTQIPGTYRKSSDARKGTELVFTSKKWFFPMLLRSDELMMLSAAYLLTGRFNPERELRRRPTASISEEVYAMREARQHNDQDTARELQSVMALERRLQFGREDEWNAYSAQLADLRAEWNFESPSFTGIKKLASSLDGDGQIEFDGNGGIWLVLRGPAMRRVGISAANAAAVDSDPELACQLMMARIGAELQSSPKNRETLPEFEADWRLLQNVHRNLDDRVLVKMAPYGLALTALSHFAALR